MLKTHTTGTYFLLASSKIIPCTFYNSELPLEFALKIFEKVKFCNKFTQNISFLHSTFFMIIELLIIII
jgi:hypothetical protein